MTDRDKVAVKAIADAAAEIYKRVQSREKPDLKFPVRSLSNVKYDPKVGYFEIGRQRATRTLTVGTAKSFAQTLRMMALSKLHIETNRRATKREAYYISKNWDDAKFDAQEESDTVMDDVEAMFSVYGVNREMMRFKPDEHGGSVAGDLIILDTAKDGKRIRIDCTGFGSGAYTIPSSVEHLQFETKAKFILVIETDGTFERLNEGEFWKTFGCILVEMKGVPSRSVRRFVRRLADERKIPVYAFTDGDPYGYANIYRTLKVGSGNAAHINKFFCVPQARFLGVTPQDILDWDLPTHDLKEQDIKRAKDALKNDPFFNREKAWVKTLEQQITMGKRVEQQAFAKHGLDFVMDEYLPAKLKHPEKFLP
ncbi:MAG: DNA topoisomerase IV subunit A [Planctomycetes bacterium]|nr:DNA topoisomerase IV subunit A [Planctomycetota bacterium]MBI3847573.1 DNA topoisomerase IV subunit A [Planctomycetota bacterium]